MTALQIMDDLSEGTGKTKYKRQSKFNKNQLSLYDSQI